MPEEDVRPVVGRASELRREAPAQPRHVRVDRAVMAHDEARHEPEDRVVDLAPLRDRERAATIGGAHLSPPRPTQYFFSPPPPASQPWGAPINPPPPPPPPPR